MPEWTAMNALVTGDLVTEEDMAALRGNLHYLLDPNKARLIHNSGSGYTTTSTAFVDIDSTNLSITLQTHGGPVLVLFAANAYASSAAYRARFDLSVDGTRYSAMPLGLLQASNLGNDVTAATPVAFAVLVTGLEAGTHTFRPQWCVTGGGSVSLVSYTAYNAVMLAAIEL